MSDHLPRAATPASDLAERERFYDFSSGRTEQAQRLQTCSDPSMKSARANLSVQNQAEANSSSNQDVSEGTHVPEALPDHRSAPVVLPMPKADPSLKTEQTIDTHHKALQINLDPTKY